MLRTRLLSIVLSIAFVCALVGGCPAPASSGGIVEGTYTGTETRKLTYKHGSEFTSQDATAPSTVTFDEHGSIIDGDGAILKGGSVGVSTSGGMTYRRTVTGVVYAANSVTVNESFSIDEYGVTNYGSGTRTTTYKYVDATHVEMTASESASLGTADYYWLTISAVLSR